MYAYVIITSIEKRSGKKTLQGHGEGSIRVFTADSNLFLSFVIRK
jgi:hypothetical protein